MSRSQDNKVAVFDRFGWYWQPAIWLEQMSPEDAVKATEQAINIQQLEKTLLLQASKNKAQAAARRSIMQQLLDSL